MPPLYLSQALKLGLSQPSLDFVDINLNGDTRLYLDPYFLGQRTDAWSVSASRTIRDFFSYFLELVRDNCKNEARALFSHLNEPNETRLGESTGRPQGRGVGAGDANKIFQSLINSKAIQSGMVEDIEDCRLFVEGIDKDKTSDMVTNIIRRHLVDYTKLQCANFGIPMTKAPTGFMWLRDTRQWTSDFDEMLMVNGSKILLVPKAIVSYSNVYTAGRYHQNFILDFLQHEHLTLGTALVERKVLKNGAVRKFVTKKRLKATVAPPNKDFITEFSLRHRAVFQNFKSTGSRVKSLSNSDLSAIQEADVAAALIELLSNTPTGEDAASQYQKIVAAILELLLYPHVITPILETKMHDGRKRVDITYDNAASEGFFWRLHQTYNTPSQFIFVECKNYESDPRNPELDQLSGRFSPNKGQFGILACRSIDDMQLFLQRCSDTYKDHRGTILPITDEDLITDLTRVVEGNESVLQNVLLAKYRLVALG